MAKIGLVLSGGGARGFAHIGVLKVLKKNNIPIDGIAGCSSGALIGALYAHDQDIERLERKALKIRHIYDIFDFSFSKTGLMKGEKIIQFILEYLDLDKAKTEKASKSKKGASYYIGSAQINRYFSEFMKKEAAAVEYNFENLKIPLKINATNILDGSEIVFDKGPLIPAIMASLSYPGVFATKKIGEKIFVDGGVIDPLPHALMKGYDYLILVDVSRSTIKIAEDSMFRDVMIQAIAIMQTNIVLNGLKQLNQRYALIAPEVESRQEFDFKNPEDAIKSGEKACSAMIDRIKADIKSLPQISLSKSL